MSLFQKINNWRGGGNESTPSEPPVDPESEQAKKEEEETAKEESRLTKVFEISRNYFISRRLKGNVYVTYTLLAFGNTISCDIDGTSEMTEVPAEDAKAKESEEEKKLSMFEKAVYNATKRAVRNMEKRAKVYKDKPYRPDMSLSCSVYVTTPGLGLVSFYINCTATVDSLLNAQEKRSTSTADAGKEGNAKAEFVPTPAFV